MVECARVFRVIKFIFLFCVDLRPLIFAGDCSAFPYMIPEAKKENSHYIILQTGFQIQILNSNDPIKNEFKFKLSCKLIVCV